MKKGTCGKEMKGKMSKENERWKGSVREGVEYEGKCRRTEKEPE